MWHLSRLALCAALLLQLSRSTVQAARPVIATHVLTSRQDDHVRSDAPVLVELFVMSHCPDALACEARLDEVLKVTGQFTEVRTHYHGYISDDNKTVTCKHGPAECAGDIQQLCVQKYAPRYEVFWRFLRCQDRNVDAIGETWWAETCLEELGSDMPVAAADQARTCYRDGEGAGLLHQSAQSTKDLGVTSSCTIWVNKSDRCLHKGKEVECDSGLTTQDFVDTICDVLSARATGGIRPQQCRGGASAGAVAK